MFGCILIIDDDRKIRELLSRYLIQKSFRTLTAGSAAEARSQLAIHTPDLIILDVMMPGEDGFMFAKKLRETSTIPIIFLSARDETKDRIHGIEIGADDYLVKPFEVDELLVRINNQLRRVSTFQSQKAKSIFRFGDITFHSEKGDLIQNETIIPLTSTEIMLMRILCQRPGEAHSREELSQKIGFRVSDRTIDVQITRLRKKLEPDLKTPRFIQTIRHIGYTIWPDP